MPKNYTVSEVANILGYSTNSIYTFLKEKKIKAVRFGKGRFRIPQAELDRLLSVSPGKKLHETQATSSAYVSHAPIMEMINSHSVVHTHMPNFFDWYLASVAMLTSATLTLFLPTLQHISVAPFLVFRPLVMTTLLMGSIGLLYTDTIEYQFHRWRGVFYMLILLGLTEVAGLFYLNGDYSWVLVLSSVVFMGLLRAWTNIDGVTAFVWHMSEMWVIFAISIILWPTDKQIVLVMQSVPISVLAMLGIIAIPTVLFGFLVLRGHVENRRLTWGLLLGTGAFFIVVSLWLGTHSLWLQAFVFLVMGFFALFVLVWLSLTLSRRDHQRIVYQVVGSMLALSLLAIVLLRLFQENVFSYAQNDLRQKTHLSAVKIESAMNKAQQTLVVFAQNPLVTAAVKEINKEDLLAVSRNVFESQAFLRRIFVTSADGTILSDYPLSGPSLTVSSLGHRDYFIQAVTSKKTTISDVLNSLTTPTRATVAIAVPMLDGKKNVVGMVVGSVDLDTINLEVQQAITTDRGEYVVVVDSTKKRIMHPDIAQIGKEVRATDPVLLGLVGEIGSSDDYAFNEDMAITAYTPIPDFRWAVSVRATKLRVLNNTKVSVIAVLSLTSVWVIMLGMIFVQHKWRSRSPKEMDSS